MKIYEELSQSDFEQKKKEFKEDTKRYLSKFGDFSLYVNSDHWRSIGNIYNALSRFSENEIDETTKSTVKQLWDLNGIVTNEQDVKFILKHYPELTAQMIKDVDLKQIKLSDETKNEIEELADSSDLGLL